MSYNNQRFSSPPRLGLWHLQLRKGDTFQTRGAMRTVEFKVMAIATATEDEAEYCYVNEDTEILCEEGETLKVHAYTEVYGQCCCPVDDVGMIFLLMLPEF